MKTCIIAHGGGMRAAFAAGALYELSKQGVEVVDQITAISASSPTAAYFVARQFEDIKQIWCEDLAEERLVSIKRFYLGQPIVDTDTMIYKIFKEKRPLSWDHISKSSTELELTAYNYVADRLQVYTNQSNFRGLDPWQLLQACMTVHNAHLQGEIAQLVDGNLVPFRVYDRSWDSSSKYIVIDNFPFWGFGCRQYLGTLLFRLFQGRNFPVQVKDKLRQRKTLYDVGLSNFESFKANCNPLVIKYPTRFGAKPMSTIARSKDKLQFLFNLGRSEVRDVMHKDPEIFRIFQNRAKNLIS